MVPADELAPAGANARSGPDRVRARVPDHVAVPVRDRRLGARNLLPDAGPERGTRRGSLRRDPLVGGPVPHARELRSDPEAVLVRTLRLAIGWLAVHDRVR